MTGDSKFQEELRRSMEEFNNRTIYKSLDVTTLSSIPDSKLDQAIIDYIYAKIGDSLDSENDVVESLSPALRGFYATWWLEAEVNNGGFNQYFWNPYGYWVEDAISALRDYRADAHAEVAAKAVAVFLAEADSHKKFRSIGTLEAFSESYKHTQLGDVDREFWAIDKSLSDLRVAYIRKNPDEFVED